MLKKTNEHYDSLRLMAKHAADQAYCPYSKFKVGAVVFDGNNNHYRGCNVENAAYGSTICAERSAICSMIATGPRDLKVVAIYTPTAHPTTPCGSCRQFINEFNPEARIISLCDSDEVLDTNLKVLLLDAFGPKNLT